MDITANSYAEISFGGNKTPTAIPAPGTFEKATVSNAVFQIAMYNFIFSDYRLIYQGNEKLFMANLLALVSHEDNISEREIRLTIFKNGSPVSEHFGKVLSPGNFISKAVSFSAEVSLTSGDYLEAMVSNGSGLEQVTVSDLKLTVK